MATDTIKALREEVDTLKKRADRFENWAKALALVALVFGIAGGTGGILLSNAREQLTALQGGVQQAKVELTGFVAAKKQELTAEAASAVTSSFQTNDAAGRLAKVEARSAQVGTGETTALSGQPIGQIRHNMVATCPPGTVAHGVTLNLGGTCNHQCDGDGQPVSQLALVCVKQ
jgi:hypothetical protein